MLNTGRVVAAGSRLFPISMPVRLDAWFSPRLERALVYAPASVYSRFAAAMFLYPLLLQSFSLVLLPQSIALFVASMLVVIETLPLTFLYFGASRRRRQVEAELPFIAMLFFILSHETFPNLPDAFARIEELGPGVFPGFSVEAQTLRRNLTYKTGSEASVVEETFADHPSMQFREFIHGYNTALVTGRDAHDFVRDESERMLDLLEARWKAFSNQVASITEVSFVVLAIFPIGMQMIAGAFLSGSSEALLLLTIVLLLGVTSGILAWMDGIQPVLYDARYPVRTVILGGVLLSASLSLYVLGVLSAVTASFAILLVSVAYVIHSRTFFVRLQKGEKETAAMLHDLAEETRAGVNLPTALSRLEDQSQRFESLDAPISTFVTLLDLGRPPKEAQRRIVHSSWLVKVSFALLAISFETGCGYEQLDKLSLSFRRIHDAKRSIQSSVLPFAVLGASVPVISVASYWFLGSIQGFDSLLPGLSATGSSWGVSLSIIATSVLTGFMVSKAYSFSLRSLVAVPPIMLTALVSFILFGL